MSLPHLQCDGGFTIDCPLGILKMQTFKKLPMQAPMQNTQTCIIIGNSDSISSIVISRVLSTLF